MQRRGQATGSTLQQQQMRRTQTIRIGHLVFKDRQHSWQKRSTPKASPTDAQSIWETNKQAGKPPRANKLRAVFASVEWHIIKGENCDGQFMAMAGQHFAGSWGQQRERLLIPSASTHHAPRQRVAREPINA